MFQLTKATEYAIFLLVSLYQSQDRPLSLKTISIDKNLPLKYLEKIASKLKDKQILKSKEGLGGGYFLARKPAKINLVEIIQAIEGKKGLVNCIHGNCFSKTSCTYQHVWRKLQHKIEMNFRNINLANLVNNQ